jgi:hypothetical protein
MGFERYKNIQTKIGHFSQMLIFLCHKHTKMDRHGDVCFLEIEKGSKVEKKKITKSTFVKRARKGGIFCKKGSGKVRSGKKGQGYVQLSVGLPSKFEIWRFGV